MFAQMELMAAVEHQQQSVSQQLDSERCAMHQQLHQVRQDMAKEQQQSLEELASIHSVLEVWPCHWHVSWRALRPRLGLGLIVSSVSLQGVGLGWGLESQ